MKNNSTLDTVIIINDFDYTQGGASKVAIDTANLLAERNDKIKVYFFSGKHNETSTLSEMVLKVCTNQEESLTDKNKIRGAINGIYNFKAKRELKKILNKCNPETTIIHVHGWTKCLSSSVFHIAFRRKFKVVLTMHDYFIACPNGGYFNYKQNEICSLKGLSWKCIKCNCDSRNYAFKLYRILRQFVQNKIVNLNTKITHAVAVSKFSEKILKETLSKNVGTSVIYNPIEIIPGKSKSELAKKNYFLYVGRISKEKGVDIFCEVCTAIGCDAVVVGDGPEKEDLESKYKNIDFVGWKSSDDVHMYMKNAKTLIFTSKWYETAGLTILEAQAAGIPCIVNDKCAGKEFIVNGVNGFTYKNIDDLKECMRKINQIKMISQDLSMYSNQIYVEKILDLYKKINF